MLLSRYGDQLRHCIVKRTIVTFLPDAEEARLRRVTTILSDPFDVFVSDVRAQMRLCNVGIDHFGLFSGSTALRLDTLLASIANTGVEMPE